MKDESVKDRLLIFIKHLGVSKLKFEKEIGVSCSYLNKLRHKPSDKILLSILSRFPELNKVWLLSGEGNMIVNPTEKDDSDLVFALREEIAYLREQIKIKDATIAQLLTKIT